jgi:hypothetical protein
MVGTLCLGLAKVKLEVALSIESRVSIGCFRLCTKKINVVFLSAAALPLSVR